MNSKERRQYNRFLYRTIIDLVNQKELYYDFYRRGIGAAVIEILSEIKDEQIKIKYVQAADVDNPDVAKAIITDTVYIHKLILSAKQYPDMWEKVTHYASTQFRKK